MPLQGSPPSFSQESRGNPWKFWYQQNLNAQNAQKTLLV